VAGHEYPIVDGVPVFILPEKVQTIGIALASYEAAQNGRGSPLYLDTIGIPDDGRVRLARAWANKKNRSHIDPAISHLVGATCGHGYNDAVGRLTAYPIPQIPVNEGSNGSLLDLGSSWGRWSIAAARRGWRVVGLDPSLGAIMAARRAFNEENVSFVCGDARFLPFKEDVFRCVFSYSVLQHFAEADAELALAEIGRVLGRNGCAKIQMAHRGGLRSTFVRTRSNYMSGGQFRVRYWSLSQLRVAFTNKIGPTRVEAEAFGGLGLLSGDWRIVSAKAKLLTVISTGLKRVARIIKPLLWLADSVYVISTKR
jgi:SAM-dependent methyltransferase